MELHSSSRSLERWGKRTNSGRAWGSRIHDWWAKNIKCTTNIIIVNTNYLSIVVDNVLIFQ